VTGKWFRGITPTAKPAEIDTTVAHPARVYDYWLGGKDNFAADREAGDRVIAVRPSILTDIRANRDFLTRSVRYLAADGGIRQFLDLGTGIPTPPNVHEVAQSAAPQSRVVYVDNDPIVLTHARALLTGSAEGVTAYLDADLRDPEKILQAAQQTLDFTEPIAVIIVGTLHLVSDDEDPYGIVTRLLAATAPGSYLAINHPASDVHAHVAAEGAKQYNRSVSTPQTRRNHAEVSRFFDGLELISPGVVQPHRWRPDPSTSPGPADEVSGWGGVARKP
jgi:S-adenosyl methyltransferase